MESSQTPLHIDKKKTCLVVIDLQKGITSFPTAPYDTNSIIKNAAKLAEVFRKNGMPVFLVHVMAGEADRLKAIADQGFQMRGPPSKDWADLLPEMGPRENDVVITKKQWGAFYGTELELQLRRRGLDTIVLCGISTIFGVESTARFAYEFGYQQIFAEDAMGASSVEEHNLSIEKVFKRMGRVRKTEEILGALE